MANNFRSALDQVSEVPISPDAVLMTLGFINQPAEISSVASILGEDASCPTCIKQIASLVYVLEKDALIERSPANPRYVQLTLRGRRRELQVREQLIRDNARPPSRSVRVNACAAA